MYQINDSTQSTTVSTLKAPEIIEATCLALFVLASLFLNISVSSVILKSKLLRRRTTNIFIINLAISNILITLLIMPFSCRAILVKTWDYGQLFCTVSQLQNIYLSKKKETEEIEKRAKKSMHFSMRKDCVLSNVPLSLHVLNAQRGSIVRLWWKIRECTIPYAYYLISIHVNSFHVNICSQHQ